MKKLLYFLISIILLNNSVTAFADDEIRMIDVKWRRTNELLLEKFILNSVDEENKFWSSIGTAGGKAKVKVLNKYIKNRVGILRTNKFLDYQITDLKTVFEYDIIKSILKAEVRNGVWDNSNFYNFENDVGYTSDNYATFSKSSASSSNTYEWRMFEGTFKLDLATLDPGDEVMIGTLNNNKIDTRFAFKDHVFIVVDDYLTSINFTNNNIEAKKRSNFMLKSQNKYSIIFFLESNSGVYNLTAKEGSINKQLNAKSKEHVIRVICAVEKGGGISKPELYVKPMVRQTPKYEPNRKKTEKKFNTKNYFKDYKERDNYFRVVFYKR